MRNTGHFLCQNFIISSKNCKIFAPNGALILIYSRFEIEKCINFPRSHISDDLDMDILSVACEAFI